jgi:hypothetical protein
MFSAILYAMPEPLDLSGRDQKRDPIQPSSSDTKPSRVERLQQKLYSPNAHFEMKSRKELQEKPSPYQTNWESTNKKTFSVEKPRLSIFAKLAIIAFVFFIGAIGYAYFMITSDNSLVANNDVELTVISPVGIGGGEELTLDIIVENKNTLMLETVDLVIEYPEGTKESKDLRTNLPRVREGLGDITPGQIVKKSYNAALFGEEGDLKDISVRVEYRLPGSTSIFEQKKNVTLALQSSPIRLLVDSVKEITAQQELVFDITLSSNSNQDLRNVIIEAKYPFGFVVSDATIRPTDKNNIWRFEELKPQEEITFQVKGRLEGQNKEERVFKWNAGIADETNPNKLGIAFINLQKSITLTQPFLALELSVDGDTRVDLVRKGETGLEGRLTYLNNTGAAINDAKIVLKLEGDVLQDNAVQVTDGFFNSTDNTITWDTASMSELKQIPVGGRETLLFKFMSKPLATRAAVFKNPELVIDATVTGRRLAEDQVPEDVKSSTVSRIKFLSDVDLSSVVSYAGEPFVNTGPIPPQVEQPTTYTVLLSVTNSSNLIQNGKVTAILPSYVQWNNTFIPSTEQVSFDPVTRRIEWNLSDVREHVGFIDPSRTLAVQLTFIPSASQVGETSVLLNNLSFEGLDTFANADVLSSVIYAPTIDLGRSSALESSKVVE